MNDVIGRQADLHAGVGRDGTDYHEPPHHRGQSLGHWKGGKRPDFKVPTVWPIVGLQVVVHLGLLEPPDGLLAVSLGLEGGPRCFWHPGRHMASEKIHCEAAKSVMDGG